METNFLTVNHQLPDELWTLILSALNVRSRYPVLRYASVSKTFSIFVYQSITTINDLIYESRGDKSDPEIQKKKIVVSNIDDQFIQRFVNLSEFCYYHYSYLLPGIITKVTDIGIKSLKNLLRLDLTNQNNITDEGIKELTKLTSLFLNGNLKITNEGISRLVNLTTLDLTRNNNIGDNAITNLTKLTYLNIQVSTKVTDYGLKFLSNLTFLDLDSNKMITNEGIKDLIYLQELNLYDNFLIGDDGIKGLTNLTDLTVGNNDLVTFEGLKNLDVLTSLDLSFNRLQNNILTQQKFGSKITKFYEFSDLF